MSRFACLHGVDLGRGRKVGGRSAEPVLAEGRQTGRQEPEERRCVGNHQEVGSAKAAEERRANALLLVRHAHGGLREVVDSGPDGPRCEHFRLRRLRGVQREADVADQGASGNDRDRGPRGQPEPRQGRCHDGVMGEHSELLPGMGEDPHRPALPRLRLDGQDRPGLRLLPAPSEAAPQAGHPEGGEAGGALRLQLRHQSSRWLWHVRLDRDRLQRWGHRLPERPRPVPARDGLAQRVG
mmetsp:Transcript_10765/g.27706  ORF Transcript_10765/g.27706 Transcript_10765/m.27706 type:complete len:239 (-) Transcript_10765:394-1110(-)